MFRGPVTSLVRAIDPALSAPYVPSCPKQSNGRDAAGADRKEGVDRPAGKLPGAAPPAGSGGPVRRSSGRRRSRAVAWDIEIGPKATGHHAWSLWDPGERPEWLEDNALITGHGRLTSGPSGYSGLSLFSSRGPLVARGLGGPPGLRNFPAWRLVLWE